MNVRGYQARENAPGSRELGFGCSSDWLRKKHACYDWLIRKEHELNFYSQSKTVLMFVAQVPVMFQNSGKM